MTRLADKFSWKPGDIKITRRASVQKFIIEKRGSKWVLLTKDRSRVLGTHDSKADAEAQERAIEASKYRGEK